MDDVQSILLVMRKEQREDLVKLGERFDVGFRSLHEAVATESGKRHTHELSDIEHFTKIDGRIKGIEAPVRSMKRAVRWLGATAIVAILGGAADAYFNHVFQEKNHDTRPSAQTRGTDR